MAQQITKSQKIIFIVIAAIVLIIVLMVLGILPGLKINDQKSSTKQIPITLEFWGIDNESAYVPIIEKYRALHNNITINYHQINEENYENQLIESLAAQNGPDILMLKHNWIPKHYNKLYPSDVLLKDLKLTFVDVVSNDLYYQNKVWALPLWVDTLALYYNKDLFNSASIPLPPTTWEEFLEDTKLLTKKDNTGNIIQSGAALGTINNIPNSIDILLLLMMHNNQLIVDEKGRGVFNTSNGSNAVNFYLSFANPASSNYSWNESFPESIEAFTQNKVAMIIDYNSAIKKIESLNAYLNYGIAPLPQPAQTLNKQNYADYWVYGVSGISKNPQAAWNFIYYLINEGAVDYLNNTFRPAANRVLIQSCKTDEKLKVFCEQALTAKTWFQLNPEKNYQILRNMLESIISGRTNIRNALGQAAQMINTSN
ncbi:MAG TPA: extracellular solute-binding protein [Candidatus Paceibacterota bacterium]|nr:extracellular solute-binding protein [Candidatus Paceibacterota bacterium]HRU35984.1 extracellular solute-binding protein [Candidatus Paceibacterota bacterium]